MPSAMPLRPKDQDEEQALEEQDLQSLSDEWQWYPWLYKDALSLLMGGAEGPQQIGGSQYSFAYNLNMGPIPDLANDTGDTTIILGGGDGLTDEQWKDLAKALSGGGADAIILPGCLITAGTSQDFLNTDRLKTKFNNITGTSGSGIAIDLTDTSTDCPYSGFELNKCCYATNEGFGGTGTCKDGISGIVVYKTGARENLGCLPYTGGSNPSGWAVLTFDQQVEALWNIFKGRMQANCDCN